MSKKDKRRQRMRQNPHKVRFDDMIGVLQDYGFEVRSTEGSHYVVTMRLGEKGWYDTVVKPHGQESYLNVKGVKRLLKALDEIDAIRAAEQAAAEAAEAEESEEDDE
jgi:hypothetical protein